MRTLNQAAERVEAALTAMSARKSDLACVLDKTPATISMYFKPDRMLRLSTLQALCDGLNLLAAERSMPGGWTVARLLGQPEGTTFTERPKQPPHARDIGPMLRLRRYSGVHCGLPDATIEDDVPTIVQVPQQAAGKGATADNAYVVPAHGASMTEAGIRSGSDLVCRTDLDPRPGDVVIAYINGDPCCRIYEKQGDVVMLVSRSAEPSTPIVILPTDDVRMTVVVSATIYFRTS